MPVRVRWKPSVILDVTNSLPSLLQLFVLGMAGTWLCRFLSVEGYCSPCPDVLTASLRVCGCEMAGESEGVPAGAEDLCAASSRGGRGEGRRGPHAL